MRDAEVSGEGSSLMDDFVSKALFHIGSFAFFMVVMTIVCLIISMAKFGGDE